MKMMDPATNTMNKLLRVLQFRKHFKELTSACKRINQETCYDSVTQRQSSSKEKKFARKFPLLRKKISSNPCRSETTCPTVAMQSNIPHLACATATNPANLTMIVKQSYKPLHSKSSQFNQKTIAVTKDTLVKALYVISNWIFVELIPNGQTGFVPTYCLDFLPTTASSSAESFAQNNLSLLNVSVCEKSHCPISTVTPPSGRFLSSIGACQSQVEPMLFTSPCVKKTNTYTRRLKDQSNLSRQISNISLHAYEHDAYGTLNLTPCRSLSFSVLDKDLSKTMDNDCRRLRVIENYQRQYIGDISVLESEVVTRVDCSNQSDCQWRLVQRGDGRQGYIPQHILTVDKQFQ